MTDFETVPAGTRAELERLREENEALRCHVQRLREVCEESQDWNWLSEKEAMEESGRDFFSIDEMQDLVDALDETPDSPAFIQTDNGTGGTA